MISILAFSGYLTAALCRFGVPTSVSETFYMWPAKYGKHLFFGFCLLVSVPLMIFWLDCSEGTLQFLIFFACAALAFVGVAAEFKGISLTRNVHYVAAGVCALCSQLWIALYTWWWIASIVLMIGAAILTRKIKGVDASGKKGSAAMFFFEVAAFLAAYIASLAYFLK